MKTTISQPLYQEAMSINRSIQRLTKGYHSNGTFNLAFKIKDDIINLCNELDQGVAARYETLLRIITERLFNQPMNY